MTDWRPVPDYEGLYEVSSDGEVRSLSKGRVINKYLSAYRYHRVDLWRSNQKKQILVHRIVARAFLGEPTPERPEVNHKDGDPLNNRLSNLEWCSRAENTNHSIYELGAQAKPIIARDTVTGAIERFRSTEEAGRFGYNRTSIWKCLHGRNRSHKGKKWEFDRE